MDLSDSTIDEQLCLLINKIVPSSRLDSSNLLDHAKKLYQIEDLEDADMIQTKIENMSSKIYTLVYKFFSAGKLTDESNLEECSKTKHTFGRLVGANHYLGRILKMNMISCNILDATYDYSQDVRPSDMECVNVFDFEKMTNFQKLLFGLRHKIKEKNLRKFGDMCMSLLKTDEGFNTRYWNETESIKDFCYQNTNSNSDFALWQCATNPAGNILSAISRLLDSEEGFTTVKKDRHLFSFKNGIYETENTIKGKWYKYNEKDMCVSYGAIQEDRVSCRYFPVKFTDCSDIENWYDIPTPHFQSIMEYQDFPEEVCKWMYILVIGRILYDVGEKDEWQVIPFLKGKAKSGKSTIVTKVCKEFYHPSDVGVLSNNIEKKFGLSAIIGKFLFIAPEIKNNLGLEQTEFQSMISGEEVQIAEKFKTSSTVKWTVPSVWAGNQGPNYSDNSGSISRRIVVFDFSKTVKHANTQLGSLLKDEIPLLIQKGNRAYLEAVAKYGTKDLWDNVLPAYFSKTSDELQEQTNGLASFLNSSFVEYSPDYFVPVSIFKETFNNFAKEGHLVTGRWTSDYYSNFFERKNITVSDIHPITKKRGNYCIGVRIVQNNHFGDDDDDELGD
jgi:hypothetical protein